MMHFHSILAFFPWDKIPKKNNLKKERYNLAHSPEIVVHDHLALLLCPCGETEAHGGKHEIQ
jgi:hypothetical protein